LANLLDKFKDVAIGSAGRDLDFTANISSRGDFTKIYDIDVIVNSWNNILTTPKGSADHDPTYGSDLYKYVFEPADSSTISGIKTEIQESLMTFDTRASISSVNVKFLRNLKGFVVDLVVQYAGNKSSLTINMSKELYQDYA
jgi:phage baseplate assembly protein W